MRIGQRTGYRRPTAWVEMALAMALVVTACAPSVGSSSITAAPTQPPEATPAPTQPPTAPPSPTPRPGPAPELYLGLDWDLVQMAGRAPLAGSQMTLVLTQEGLSGIAACNHYFGSYQLDGQTLTVGVLGRTEMYCDGRMEQEDAYLALLAAAQTLTVESGRLVIGTPEEDLVYELAENAKLEGAEWTLDGLAQGDAIVQTWLDPEITALFEDGRVSGSAGCNRYFANYTLDGGAITVGAVGSTRMMCDDERMERERGFLDALARAAQWRIRRQSLTLYDADGNVLMMLTTAAG